MLEQRDVWIGALLRERAGSARGGNTDHMAQIDARLAELGYVPEPTEAKAPPRRTTAAAKRTTRRG